MKKGIEPKYTHLTPFKRCVLQNFPFIEANFDALTNYGLLSKIVEYLNEVIESQNTVQGNVEELNNAFIALRDEFHNLDLQDEVNNKLDEMADNGTLADILQNLINQADVINFHTVMATKYFRSSEEAYGMQGGCVLPDETIIQCTGNQGEVTGKILHYAQDGTLLNSKTVDYGHCNGVTYNTKTGSVFITSTQSETIGYYKIFEVDPETLDELHEYDVEDKDFPDRPYGIVYVEEDDSYVFVNYWRTTGTKYMWKCDNEFNVIDSKEIDVEVRSTSNIGRFGNYLGVNTISDNAVMLFNPISLEFFKESTINNVISDTWVLTEVEWFDTRNGKVYLGFIPAAATSPITWGGGTKVFACYDPDFNYNEIRKTNTQFSPAGERYYVDYTASYNPLRDGSSDAPFENINEALNASLRTGNVTGEVTIYIKQGSSADTFYPFFSMNKTYKVVFYGSENNTNLHTISGIFVNRASKVIISGPVVLTAGSTTYKDANILNRGELYIDGILKMSDDSKLILSGENSTKITCKIDTSSSGFDLTDFYGKLVNIGAEFVPATAADNFLTLRSTGSSTQLTMQLINFRTTVNMISENSNTYQLPNFAPRTNYIVRFNLPNGDSTAITYEPVLTYIEKLYSDNTIPYIDTDSSNKVLHIRVTEGGVMSFAGAPTGGLSNLRVRVCTGE